MKLPDAIEHIKTSIVQIRRMSPAGHPAGEVIGTGFVVSEKMHIITAHHVVSAVDADAGQTITVAHAGPDLDAPVKLRRNFSVARATIAHKGLDPGHDLALLEGPEPQALRFSVGVGDRVVEATPRPAAIIRSDIRAGLAIAVSGYPLWEPSLVTNAGIVASIYSPGSPGGANHECYLADLTANKGNSGGPAYTVDGAAVIGVCVMHRPAPVMEGAGAYGSGLTVVVPASDVLNLMVLNGVLLPTALPRQRSSPARSRR